MYQNNQNNQSNNNQSQLTNGNEEPEQSRVEAQQQREECITTVIVNLFDKLGYKCDVQPAFPNQLSPDVLAEKGNDKVIIELKAYFKRMVCAEPEVAQAIKYAQAARDNKFASKVRVLLITSGKMVPTKECGFFCGGDPIEHTIARYTKLKQENKMEKGLEKWDTRGIYSRAEEKVRKITWTPGELPAMDINSHKDFLQFLDDDAVPILLGCVSVKGIEDALKHEDLKFELQAFKRLENTPLRVLMNHERILQIKRKKTKEKPPKMYEKNNNGNGAQKSQGSMQQNGNGHGAKKPQKNGNQAKRERNSSPRPRNPFM